MSKRALSLRTGLAFACVVGGVTGFAACGSTNNGWGDGSAGDDSGGAGSGNAGSPSHHAGNAGQPSMSVSGAPATGGNAGSEAGGRGGTAGVSGTGVTAGMSASAGTAGTTASAGSAGTASTAGSGGTAGTAGTAGKGGSAGTGGTAGSGGTAGTSGTAGTAGTSGTAGASGTAGSAGTAGTSGSGGTAGTAGTSGTAGAGGSGPVCGNGTVEAGEKCDTLGGASPSCDGTCQFKVSTSACVDCEAAGDCVASVDNCLGPVANPFTPAQQAQCYATMACIESSNCLDGAGTLTKCYCGTLSTSACSAAPFDLTAPGAPNGQCAAAIKAGMTGFTSNSAILTGLTASSKPAGAAMQRLNCQKTANTGACTDICGFTPGGPVFP